MEQLDGRMNAGRKGVAYDWQAVLAAHEAESLDHDLLTFAPEHAA